MSTVKMWAAVALALVIAPSAHAEGPAQNPNAFTTETPGGEYQTAWLTLSKGWEYGVDVQVFLGFRGGQATAAWFAAPARSDCHHVWVDQIALKLDRGSLKGEIRGRMVKAWAPIAHVGDYVYSLDANINGSQVTGTFNVAVTPKGHQSRSAGGNLTGTVQTEEQAKATAALPAGKDWPGYYGVDFSFRGPDCGARMIDHWKDAKPLWKAEEPLPCMWGKGPDGRYKDRVCVVGVDGSGASSPVVAGGMVYVFYFRPSGELKSEQQLRDQAAKVSDSPIAQQAYLDWHRTRADDVVVAMDGAMGKIVWKSVLKGRSFNLQTHKWRGYNPAPRVFEGVVYVGDYGGRVYALDAKTGKLLWEYSSGVSAFGAGATGPVVADGVLVASAGGTVGLDRASGKPLWKGPAGNLLVWRKGQVERVLVSGHGEKGKTTISCLDAKTGKAMWSVESPFWGLGDVYPIVDGDYLVGYDATKGDKAGEADFGKDTQVLCYRLGEQGMERAWAATAPYPAIDKLALTIANGHVYIDGAAETFCLKLPSGEKVATAKAGGARTQAMFAANGRVFIQPEGRHGGQSFFMLEADPKDFRVVPAGNAARETKHAGEGQWVPLHTPDTAYANQPVIYPVVDGRLFVRGHDGLYCYDLRK